MELNNNIVIPDKLAWTEGKVKNFFGKDLIALQNGSLKLVKVAPFSAYPEHVHQDKTEYVYILHGEPSFVIDGNHFDGKPNEFFVFPQKSIHAILNKIGRAHV